MPSVSQKQANLMSAIKHGWQPPKGMHAPSLKVAQEFHAADKRIGKYMHADGGSIDEHDLLIASPPKDNKTEHFLKLVSHAADRATATVTDDPHHALARVASGLASQVVGQTRSGRPEFGRLPNLVDEVRSLPGGLANLGVGATNVLGSLADRYLPESTPGTIGHALRSLRDSVNRLTDGKDVSPKWSTDAADRADAFHKTIDKTMGLSAPRGFTENAADSAGVMLGQIPIPFAEAKTGATVGKGALAALAHAIPEYLGPTVRPSMRNYLTGALGGGALGTLSSPAVAAEAPPPETGPYTKEKFE